MRSLLSVILFYFFIPAMGQYNHPFDYCTGLKDATFKSKPGSLRKFNAEVAVWDQDSSVYAETHSVVADSAGNICFQLGKGLTAKGKFDSLIWSVGTYYLLTELREMPGRKLVHRERQLMRRGEDLKSDHEQGTHEFPEAFGTFSLSHSRRKRPVRIQLDIITSYVNTAYPADTYPMYLHLEWLDPERDGRGNSFSVSYSQNSSNAFHTDSSPKASVSLYSSHFQEITADPGAERIQIELSRPGPIDIYGQIYRIKGPCTLIYYFEW